ncbi:TPA: hypothetical protein GFZ04_23920 [Escherichia coli]|nr:MULTISPECIES: hypothetical protein [Escherichia]MCM4396684.1 hypothetical protein [Escherichia coli]MCM4534977.1 hypothetical protein [Escherichia coli]MCM5168658.1 hypothetical protein [Escherichia coli]MCZ8799232.1 hypothetical protein [Escherichia albertii]HAH3029714.1 hypothetical protein [Escherichia albertii]
MLHLIPAAVMSVGWASEARMLLYSGLAEYHVQQDGLSDAVPHPEVAGLQNHHLLLADEAMLNGKSLIPG